MVASTFAHTYLDSLSLEVDTLETLLTAIALPNANAVFAVFHWHKQQ